MWKTRDTTRVARGSKVSTIYLVTMYFGLAPSAKTKMVKNEMQRWEGIWLGLVPEIKCATPPNAWPARSMIQVCGSCAAQRMAEGGSSKAGCVRSWPTWLSVVCCHLGHFEGMKSLYSSALPNDFIEIAGYDSTHLASLSCDCIATTTSMC